MTGEETDPVCILGSGVASAARADIGSYLLLTDIDNNEHEFEVIGIFTVASKIYTHDLIITSFNHSHAFFGLKDYQATDLAVWLEPGTNPATVSIAISAVTEGIKIIDKQVLGNLIEHSNNEKAGFYTAVWYLLLLGMLLFAFTISSAVSGDARKEIGLLKKPLVSLLLISWRSAWLK